jgi:hypothetical protein
LELTLVLFYEESHDDEVLESTKVIVNRCLFLEKVWFKDGFLNGETALLLFGNADSKVSAIKFDPINNLTEKSEMSLSETMAFENYLESGRFCSLESIIVSTWSPFTKAWSSRLVKFLKHVASVFIQ